MPMHSLCLAPESFQCLMVPRDFVWQELERHEAVQACILGLVDDTHPTTTEFLDDAVMGNRAAEDG